MSGTEKLMDLRAELKRSIPVEEVHLLLDRLGAPRTKDDRTLFIAERFDWLNQMLYGRNKE